MRFPAFTICSLNRTLTTGCGFLLLFGPMTCYGQRGVELQISGGISATRPDIERNNLPRNFRFNSLINTGAALRLTLPVSQRIGIGLEQRVTSLNNALSYSLGTSTKSAGFGQNTVHQSGVSVRFYDVWTPGIRWALDMVITGSYGWASDFRGHHQYYDQLFNSSELPTPTTPVVVASATSRPGRPMAGAEMLLQYELGPRHSLLLTATYQRGLRQLLSIRSTRLEYVDETRTVQQGGFVFSSRGSYAAVQLGYGVRFGGSRPAANRYRTPRYSHPPDGDDEPPTE